MCRICGCENFHALNPREQLIFGSYVLNRANGVVIAVEPLGVGRGNASGDAIQPTAEVVYEIEPCGWLEVKCGADVVVRA
jgi:hypothetical protein